MRLRKPGLNGSSQGGWSDSLGVYTFHCFFSYFTTPSIAGNLQWCKWFLFTQMWMSFIPRRGRWLIPQGYWPVARLQQIHFSILDDFYMHLFKGFSLYLLHLTGSLINWWVKFKDSIRVFCMGPVILFVKKNYILFFLSIKEKKKTSPDYNWVKWSTRVKPPSLHLVGSRQRRFLYFFSLEDYEAGYLSLITTPPFLYLCPFPTKFFFPLLKTLVSIRSLPSPLGKIILRERSNRSHLQLRVNSVQ